MLVSLNNKLKLSSGLKTKAENLYIYLRLSKHAKTFPLVDEIIAWQDIPEGITHLYSSYSSIYGV